MPPPAPRIAEVRIAVGLALQRHGGAELERFATGGAGKKEKGEKAKAAAAAAVAEGGKEAAADGGAAAEGLQQYVRQLQDAFLSGGAGEGGEGGGQQQRQWAVEQLCSVLKQRAAPAAAKLEVLRFLAVHALFSLDAAAAKKVGGRCLCCARVGAAGRAAAAGRGACCVCVWAGLPRAAPS